MRREAAFTLLELLATVAIIATLAALISAATLSGKDSAKVAKSVANLRQIAVAMNVYAGENADHFPLGYYYQGTVEKTFVSELAPYLDVKPDPQLPNRNIFIAPTSVIPVPAKSATATIPMTYSVHGLICPDSSLGSSSMMRSQIKRPTQVILIGDSAQSPTTTLSRTTFSTPTAFKTAGAGQDLNTLIPVTNDADTTAGAGQLRYRSRGAAAVAMVDGHVELLKKGTVTYGNIIADR